MTTQTAFATRLLLLLIGISFPANFVSAYTIEDLSDIPVFGDFVVGPTKNEIFLNPGETAVTEMYVLNRLGRAMAFEVNVKDFTGSYDPKQPTVILETERSPYSLRDYLTPDIAKFNLSHGQKIRIPIRISIPEDAEPGGRYGAVLVNSNPEVVSPTAKEGAAGTQIQVKTRIASLFFVTVRGDMERRGELKDFRMTGKPNYGFYQKGPFGFEIYFENKGNVHLVPYGGITITNMAGNQVGQVEIDPYFAMPQSLRARKVEWRTNQLMFGKYTATLNLNRGYDNIVDTKAIEFWVIPLKRVAVGFGIIVLVVLVLWWIVSRFEIRLKGPGKKSKESNE